MTSSRQGQQTRGLRACGAALAVLFATNTPSSADAQNPGDSAKVHELTLEENSDIKNGRIAMVEGETDPTGVRLLVSKLSILQPVAVTLVALDSNDDLQLSLWKYAEDAVAREGSTRGKGYVTFQLRTEDDLQIRVASPRGPSRYRLAVWAGNEVELPVPSPFVSQAGFTGGSGDGAGSTPTILYVLTAGVLAIAGLLAVLVMRRKKT